MRFSKRRPEPARTSSLSSVGEAGRLALVDSSPRYDRSKLGCGIAHLGVGNFHRSHQALFLHNYLQDHAEDWMIHGVACLESDRSLVDAMNSQRNLYTLTERSGQDDVIKVIGSMKELTLAPSNPAATIELLASDHIKIVSMTITEKGYYYGSSGDLELDHPVIKKDLEKGSTPSSALAYLFAAAERRMAEAGQQFTIMSCDNLPGNGELTRHILLQFADAKDRSVASWIRENVSFPNSMVDRITPAVTEATTAFVRDTFRIDDKCPVISESFLQWVMEDDFINGRPNLESVGVQFTKSVEPYEVLKVRLLNGSHSALSYVAYLAGFKHVDVAMSDQLVRTFVQRYMDDDITPSVPDVPGVDISSYKTTLLSRFANPAIRDQVQRLAMDGSQKIKNAMVPPLEFQLAHGGSIRWIAFALASWYRYLRGVDEAGRAIEIIDPLRDGLMARAALEPTQPVNLLNMQEIFGAQLSTNARLADEVQEALDAIDALGMRAALTQYLK